MYNVVCINGKVPVYIDSKGAQKTRMKNKLIKVTAYVLVLTASLIFAGWTNAFASDFPDIEKSHLNYDAVTYLTGLGVIAGYDDGTFKPEREITRTEFCALMARTLGYNKESYTVLDVPFSDVNKGYWGEPFISFCFEIGLIDGMGDGTFAPAAKVTLEQAVKMAVCAIGKQDEALRVNGEKWYTGYAQVAGRYGLLTTVNQEFGENAGRGNVAQIVFNMVETGLTEMPTEDKNDTNSETEEDTDNNQTDETEKPEEPVVDKVEKPSIPPEIIAAYREKDFSNVKTILIDAGHNYSGKDIGAENPKYNAKEEVITFQIADKLKAELEYWGYNVIMTREKLTDSIANTSVNESLQARVDMAHEVLADLFISIHCNAGGGSGVETYCFAKTGYSGRLAELIQNSIADGSDLYDRGVKTANFFVIKNTLMPTILVETGFIDSEKDIQILMSEEGQNQIAGAIASAIREFDLMDPIVETAKFDELSI